MTDLKPRTAPTIALIAHDNKKQELVDWVGTHRSFLSKLHLLATGTTGHRIASETGLAIERVQSGPHGGDLQIGAKIADGAVDAVIFLWDPLSPQPHDVDVKALLRIAVLYNIPLACNFATADAVLEHLSAKQRDTK